MSFIVKARQAEKGGDNIKEWTGLQFDMSQRAVENTKMEETGCKVVGGVPTAPVVKG